jgi:hypothetical protein
MFEYILKLDPTNQKSIKKIEEIAILIQKKI